MRGYRAQTSVCIRSQEKLIIGLKKIYSKNLNSLDKKKMNEKISVFCRKYFVQLTAALAHMHSRRVMHRGEALFGFYTKDT